jgi:hypothetical protein
MAATELHSAVSMIIPCVLYHAANRFLEPMYGSWRFLSMQCNHFQGFTDVTDIAGGFSSWREKGLPINQ